MAGRPLTYIMCCLLIAASISFCLPAADAAQSAETPASNLASKLKLEAPETTNEITETNNNKTFLSAAEVVLGGNLKAYFTLKVPSVTVLTKKQNMSYSRALFGLNLAF